MTSPKPARIMQKYRTYRLHMAPFFWPTLALLLLIALIIWQVNKDSSSAITAHTQESGDLVNRSFGSASIDMPRSWRTLDRTKDSITWGSINRMHTLTLATTESSSVPLISVVKQVSANAIKSFDGATITDGPYLLDNTDSQTQKSDAVLVQLTIPARNNHEIEIIQVWQRDLRSSTDAVATWTSANKKWEASPAKHLPQISPNG